MSGSIEKVYSQALLELASEDESYAVINEELSILVDIFARNKELYEILSSPAITDEEKKELLSELFEGKITRSTYGLLYVLVDNGRVKYLPSIAKSFRKGYFAIKGIVEATVTTVKPLDIEQREKLIAKLSSMYEAEVVLREKIDESIIGGMTVKCGDSMLDGSVKSKLEAMKRQVKGIIA